MKRALVVVLLTPVTYVMWWHVSFLLVMGLNGSSIDFDLYSSYVRQFLFGPGLEIPSYIKVLAIAGTIVTVAAVLVATGLQAALRARRARRARAAGPPVRAT